MTAFRPGFLDELPPDPAMPGTVAFIPTTASASSSDGATPRSPIVMAEERLGPHAPGFVETTSQPPPADGEEVWAPARIEVARSLGSGALTWIAAGGALLIVSAVLLSAAASVLDHMARSHVLGLVALFAYGTALGLIAWGVALEVRSYRRLKAVDALRRVLHRSEASVDEMRASCLAWLNTLGPTLPGAVTARAALNDCRSVQEVRAALRQRVLEPLRLQARHAGQRAGLQGGALVAITPSPALGGFASGLRALALIREVAGLYGLRPGTTVTVVLLRRATWTAMGVTGADMIALTAAQQLLGHVPVLQHIVAAVPGAGLAAWRLGSLASMIAEACSPLPPDASRVG